MAVKTTTVYICDCCGKEDECSDFSTKANEFGSSTVSIKGSVGQVTWQGDTGGISVRHEVFVCHECSSKIVNHMRTLGYKG